MLLKIILVGLLSVLMSVQALAESYPIVDSGQQACFDDSRQIRCPQPGDAFNGQDAQYEGNKARYLNNDDGTVTDLVTGLMWVKARGEKMSWDDAISGAKKCRVGGHTDWRAPTIKELYSLIDFNGWVQPETGNSTPFINTRYFDFAYGDTASGERNIDCQDWSATSYVSKTMNGSATAFGVNFADGRIKGYPKRGRGSRHNKYIRYVRGNTLYGQNAFVAQNDGTIADKATGLTWQQADSKKAMNWQDALGYCENLNLGGRTDWRLPSVKELQSIVDYTRSPQTSNSAAIAPLFAVTKAESYFWSSTTHMDGPKPIRAAYVAFGRAMGYFSAPQGGNSKRFMDVHGAGAQRSDPKSGDPNQYMGGHGPQGDDVRIDNYVRCVRGGGVQYYEPPFKRIPTWKGGRNPNESTSSGMGQGVHQGSRPQTGMQGQSGRRMGPPREAYEACNGQPTNSDCSFRAPHGTVNGICADIAGDSVCVPKGGPMGRPPRQ